MRRMIIILFALTVSLSLNAQIRYKVPPKEVLDIVDAPPTPSVSMSPRGDAMMLIESNAMPPLSLVVQPIHRIAGMRISPQLHARQRLNYTKGILVQQLPQGKPVRIDIPANAKIGMPLWSHDGTKIAFSRDVENGVELWVAEVKSAKCHRVGSFHLNDILGQPVSWMGDNVHLLVKMVPSTNSKSPKPQSVPIGPNVEETSGRISRTPTFQDLLKTPYDEELFAYFSMSQLGLVSSTNGALQLLGKPDMYTSIDFSPSEQYLLVSRIKQPFSYRVPSSSFARSIEIWDAKGKHVKVLADLPIADDVPTQGVQKGPRSIDWQSLHPATLVWAEALDGGDPMQKVPNRDRVLTLSAPFTAEPSEIMKVQHRFSGLAWTAQKDAAILTETNRDRRWRTTWFVNLQKPETKKTLFDLSTQDAYNDPGRPLADRKPNGETTLLQDGDWIYLTGDGASEQGERPFIDKFNLVTLQKERLFQSDEKKLERFMGFVKGSRSNFVIRSESKTEVPNYFLLEAQSKSSTPLTQFKDPAPQLTGIRKELIKYTRADGVPLSGTLYLPPGYKEGTRLPCIIWAYPLEYSDAGTAGQVRVSPNAFTFFRGASQLLFLTQGYAVLNDATMPVVGDPETMNNTFIEQIVSSAKAAIDKLDQMGVIDPKRVAVAGHSYGAFMTANLLAHSDLFAAGIARSGAYNRTLTPFGFQSERRSFWDAQDVYMKVSPFMYANKINEPILLIHGEADNNQGTFPIQSDRLFQAIRGNGGTARLVLLPFESHGYSARESNLHTLAEMFEWADKYVKNKK
ncbi:MAG: prolyl oligopeptidase family serine peptidase [bacterium]